MAKQPYESRIQDLVYSIDTGFGLRLIQVGAYVLLLVLLMLVYTATQFRGLNDPQAMDYAQLGRNLVERRSFTTQFVRPVSMARMYERSPERNAQALQHPDLFHPPLYPTLLAAGFRLLPGAFPAEPAPGIYRPEQWVIVPLNYLFLILSGILVLLIGRRLFTPRIALLSMTVYFLSQAVWSDAISGLGLPFLTFLVLGAFYFMIIACAAREEHAPASRWLSPLVLSALFCGLAFLTRYAALALLPGLLLYLALSPGRRRLLPVLLYGAIALGVLTPWLVRNVRVSGHPLGMAHWGLYHDAGTWSGDSIERIPTTDVEVPLRSLQAKWLSQYGRFYGRELLATGDGLLFAFFLASLFFKFVRRPVHLLRWCVALSMLALVVLGAAFGPRTLRVFAVFWPMAILYGMAFYSLLLERLRLKIRLFSIAITVLFVSLAAKPLVLALLPPWVGVPYPPYYPPFIMHVSRMLEPHEALCTDMPWATAWYGNRASIYLPRNLEEFYRINDYQQRISGLYFTTLTRDKPYIRTLRTGEHYRTWFPILEGRIPGDFPLTQGFPLNNLDQLFLTDRPRWGPQPQPQQP